MPHPGVLKATTLALTLGALVACGEAPPPASEPVTMRDSSGVTIVEQDLAQLGGSCSIGAQPTLSIGVEEGEPEYMLAGLFGAVRLSDGRIVIAQRSTHDIRYYDSTGAFLRTSGREGRGPGEFSSPFYLHVVPGDTVYAGDYDPWQFLVFDPEGNWVRSVKPTPTFYNSPDFASVLEDRRLLLGAIDRFGAGDPATFPQRYMLVTHHDAAGVVTDTMGNYASARYGQVEPGPGVMTVAPLFESSLQIDARGRRVVYGHASATELRVHRVDSTTVLERVIRWNDGPRDITPEDISVERDRLAARYPNLAPEMRERMVEPLISESRPIAEQFPAFGQLRIATDDKVWIREYPRPRDDSTTYRWIAFQPDGTFACRLTTPRFDQFYEFGAEYLLVRERDELGVERVRQYPIQGG
jgi:hypothetical protein